MFQNSLKKVLTGKNIIYFGLALALIGMPLSKFLMGLSNFVLFGGWLIEGNFARKLENFKNNRVIHICILLFAVHVLGLVYSSDFKYGLNDLRIKLPLLILPILIGTSECLNEKVFKALVKIFIFSVFIATVVSAFIWLGFSNKVITDVRQISVFVSHIRFSLMICLSFFFVIYFYRDEVNKKLKLCWLLLAVWLFCFLIILQSFTGLVILFLISLFLLIYFGISSSKVVIRYATVLLLLMSVASCYFYVNNIISEFKDVPYADIESLEKYTANGNPYHHTNEYNEVENGNHVGIYLCEPELKEAWAKRSEIPYESMDLKGQPIRYTLMRYLTSKNLRKDANGVYLLNIDDVNNIESGIPNYKYTNRFSLYPRIHQILYEYYSYKHGKAINGYSVVMRAEFFSNTLNVFKRNWLVGTGTGDIVNEEQNQYIVDNCQLDPVYRLHAHNQFITFAATFGILGFVLILFSMYYPLFVSIFRNNYFYLIFIVLITLSMLNEDTLETQAGTSLFAIFNTLILFSFQRNKNQAKQT